MTWSDIPWRPTTRTLRQFALLWLVAVGLLAGRVGLGDGQPFVGVFLGALAGAVGIAGLVRPAWVRPVFVALTVVTFPLGWAMSRVLLAVLFYGLFIPLGLVFRLLGRDALETRARPDPASYWQAKVLADDPRRYLRPF